MTKILAVDDSPTMHKLFKMIFSREDYILKLADNGEEGLNLIKEFNPDIVLLDFIMPKINGFQFCKIVREDFKLSDLPIVLITSKAEDVGSKFTERFKRIEYIAKPFQPDELIEKVENILKEHKAHEIETIEIDTLLDIEKKETEELAEVLDIKQKDSAVRLKSVEEEIISKVEKDVIPTLRKAIEKFLRFETGYMISDIKGEKINLDTFVDILAKLNGELIIFNNEEDYHFYMSGGFIRYSFKGNSKISEFLQLMEDVTGHHLLKVDNFVKLYEQLRELGVEDSLIKRCFTFYVSDLLDRALQLIDSRYYCEAIDIPDGFLAKNWVTFENIENLYNFFKEEKIEINKIIYDESLIPKQVPGLGGELKGFELRIYKLCDGRRCVGEILNFFGANRQYAKNIMGTLLLTGYLKV
jgi:DNA-binding response OmpR family regulator